MTHRDAYRQLLSLCHEWSARPPCAGINRGRVDGAEGAECKREGGEHAVKITEQAEAEPAAAARQNESQQPMKYRPPWRPPTSFASASAAGIRALVDGLLEGVTVDVHEVQIVRCVIARRAQRNEAISGRCAGLAGRLLRCARNDKETHNDKENGQSRSDLPPLRGMTVSILDKLYSDAAERTEIAVQCVADLGPDHPRKRA
jgi:hypothetical protein